MPSREGAIHWDASAHRTLSEFCEVSNALPPRSATAASARCRHRRRHRHATVDGVAAAVVTDTCRQSGQSSLLRPSEHCVPIQQAPVPPPPPPPQDSSGQSHLSQLNSSQLRNIGHLQGLGAPVVNGCTNRHHSRCLRARHRRPRSGSRFPGNPRTSRPDTHHLLHRRSRLSCSCCRHPDTCRQRRSSRRCSGRPSTACRYSRHRFHRRHRRRIPPGSRRCRNRMHRSSGRCDAVWE